MWYCKLSIARFYFLVLFCLLSNQKEACRFLSAHACCICLAKAEEICHPVIDLMSDKSAAMHGFAQISRPDLSSCCGDYCVAIVNKKRQHHCIFKLTSLPPLGQIPNGFLRNAILYFYAFDPSICFFTQIRWFMGRERMHYMIDR